MNLNLENKIAFVAASSSGLRFATALELAREKARVIITGRSSEKLAESSKKILAEVPNDRSMELLKYYSDTNHTTIEEQIERIASDIPLKRIATPEEFAKVATFLVSSAASYLTGVMLQVDGGRYKGLV